eukprot:2118785-Pleurochrysis_carterae.AAC.2
MAAFTMGAGRSNACLTSLLSLRCLPCNVILPACQCRRANILQPASPLPLQITPTNFSVVSETATVLPFLPLPLPRAFAVQSVLLASASRPSALPSPHALHFPDLRRSHALCSCHPRSAPCACARGRLHRCRRKTLQPLNRARLRFAWRGTGCKRSCPRALLSQPSSWTCTPMGLGLPSLLFLLQFPTDPSRSRRRYGNACLEHVLAAALVWCTIAALGGTISHPPVSPAVLYLSYSKHTKCQTHKSVVSYSLFVKHTCHTNQLLTILARQINY